MCLFKKVEPLIDHQTPCQQTTIANEDYYFLESGVKLCTYTINNNQFHVMYIIILQSSEATHHDEQNTFDVCCHRELVFCLWKSESTAKDRKTKKSST